MKSNITKKWIIFDLDGVLVRWVNAHIPDPTDLSTLIKKLQFYKERGYKFSVLTNRPPSQMPLLAYLLGIDYGYWITESGGSIYDVEKHKVYPSSVWISFTKNQIPRLRQILHKKLSIPFVPNKQDKIFFEPGMGFVKSVLVTTDKNKMKSLANKIKDLLDREKLDNDFNLKIGKAIDIDPIGLSKEKGMQLLLRLNKINPTETPTIFIADHERDIPGAKILLDNGGYIAAVGNSSEEFKLFVKNNPSGILAPDNTDFHSSVCDILDRFHKNVFDR